MFFTSTEYTNPMNWTPITQALPPDGEVVETKDDGYDFGRVYLLYYDYDLDNWVGGHPKNYTPTHWRKKEETK